jgi:hypothetical protein
MCRPANAAFLRKGFAWQPSLRSPLDLPPPWQQLFKCTVGGGGQEKKFSNNILQTWEIRKLYIKLGDKCQMALFLGEMGTKMCDRAVTRGLWSVQSWKT